MFYSIFIIHNNNYQYKIRKPKTENRKPKTENRIESKSNRNLAPVIIQIRDYSNSNRV